MRACGHMHVRACIGNTSWGAGYRTNEAPEPLSLGVDFSRGFPSPWAIPDLS